VCKSRGEPSGGIRLVVVSHPIGGIRLSEESWKFLYGQPQAEALVGEPRRHHGRWSWQKARPDTPKRCRGLNAPTWRIYSVLRRDLWPHRSGLVPRRKFDCSRALANAMSLSWMPVRSRRRLECTAIAGNNRRNGRSLDTDPWMRVKQAFMFHGTRHGSIHDAVDVLRGLRALL